jgi:hypothetical protein
MSYKKNNLTNGIQKLDDEDTELVTGGRGFSIKYNQVGHNDTVYTCPACGFKEEVTNLKWEKDPFTGAKCEEGPFKNVWCCRQCHSRNQVIFKLSASFPPRA